MHTVVLGTDFHNVKLDLLETIHFDAAKITQFVRAIPPNAPVKELVVLATCNRCELYFSSEDAALGLTWLKRYMASYFAISELIFDQYFYQKNCEDAVRHLFSVVSGIESMVFGECEILSQVKDAYSFCLSLGVTGPNLNKLFQSAIALGKSVRDQTAIQQGRYSISSIAINTMEQYFSGSCLDKRILIVGAGVMSQRALACLKSKGYENVYISNRREERALSLAEQYGYSLYDYSQIRDAMASFDVIYFATGSKDYLLSASDYLGLASPLLMLDLGVPRNLDPQLAHYPDIHLVSIDDFERVANETIKNREQERDKILAIIDTQFSEFSHWYGFRQQKTSA